MPKISAAGWVAVAATTATALYAAHVYFTRKRPRGETTGIRSEEEHVEVVGEEEQEDVTTASDTFYELVGRQRVQGGAGVRGLPVEIQLELYGLYKVATKKKLNPKTTVPSILHVADRAKYDAYKKCSQVMKTRAEAGEAYLELAAKYHLGEIQRKGDSSKSNAAGITGNNSSSSDGSSRGSVTTPTTTTPTTTTEEGNMMRGYSSRPKSLVPVTATTTGGGNHQHQQQDGISSAMIHQLCKDGELSKLELLRLEFAQQQQEEEEEKQLDNNDKASSSSSSSSPSKTTKSLSFISILNARNEFGETPLHCAADGGHIRVLEWLVERGADATLTEPEASQTPLHYACGQNHPQLEEIVILLVSRGGADLQAVDVDGATALDLLPSPEDAEMIRHAVENHFSRTVR